MLCRSYFTCQTQHTRKFKHRATCCLNIYGKPRSERHTLIKFKSSNWELGLLHLPRRTFRIHLVHHRCPLLYRSLITTLTILGQHEICEVIKEAIYQLLVFLPFCLRSSLAFRKVFCSRDTEVQNNINYTPRICVIYLIVALFILLGMALRIVLDFEGKYKVWIPLFPCGWPHGLTIYTRPG